MDRLVHLNKVTCIWSVKSRSCVQKSYLEFLFFEFGIAVCHLAISNMHCTIELVKQGIVGTS